MAEGDTFASRLRAIRQAKGLTQRQLAERSGLDAGHIGRIESRPDHEPRAKTKQKLAEGLGVSAHDLEASRNDKASWHIDFMNDPDYSSEFKKSVLLLAEQEKQRLIQKRRGKK